MNLLFFIEKHIHKRPKKMNVAFQELAKENGITLDLGTDYSFSDDKDELTQAVDVGEGFVDTLLLLDAHLEPSFEEINKELLSKNGPYEMDVKIVASECGVAFKGIVFSGHMEGAYGNTLSFWMDTNDLEML